MTRLRMPAEWEPHIRTWMCWPCRASLWGDGLAAARAATADVARAIARFEPVVMAARPQDARDAEMVTGFLPPQYLQEEMAQRGVGNADPNCDRGGQIWQVALDDSWARDIGPTFVEDGPERAAIGWRFNAWGGKYTPFDRDAAFAQAVAEKAAVPFHRAAIICEGGAIHSDGQGTLLTTEQCLLNPNRNPGLTRDTAEDILFHATGAQRVIWLGDGFADTETDGHVDNIACFAGPSKSGRQKVIVGVPDSKSHPDAAPVAQAIRRLKAAGLEVAELLQPRCARAGLPASYVNFALCNGGLVMPSFDDPNDDAARAVLADCFADRAIAVVPALDIVRGGGGIHCITQQEPAPWIEP